MQEKRLPFLSLICTLSLLCFSHCVHTQKESKSWTNFRGPEENGQSLAKNVPTHWDDSTNVTWKVPIPGLGWSSPVVLNNRVWFTSAPADGGELRLLAVDASTGEMLQNLKLFEVNEPQEQHPLNSFASPSPVIEEGRVYAHFGAYGTACVDTETGKVLWERTDFYCNHDVGPGSSPTLYKDLLLLTFDGIDVQFLVALDKQTGETVWKRDREVDMGDLPLSNQKAFTTPIVRNINGIDQIISVGPHAVMGYQTHTGERIWRALFEGFSASSRPVVGDSILFFNSGFGKSSLIALRLGGEGDITDDILWINSKNTQARSSALYIDGLIYMVNTGGQAKCFVGETGEEIWTVRVGRLTSASPIYAGGHIYTFDESGLTTVFNPGKVFEKVGENQLPDGFMASPAVVDNALFLRTKTHLYKIQQEVQE